MRANCCPDGGLDALDFGHTGAMSPGRADDGAGGLIEGILQRADSATPPGDVASELLTFLFADIRGYTRFTQERGDEAAAELTAKFGSIVRDLVARFGGTVFELRGDEAMCVFASPRQTFRLAVALQERFVDETTADPTRPMTVGIGIDAGEAVRGPDGYRGGALNLAARLCARAKAGEILASPEVAHLAGAIDGIRYVVLDRITLKGLDQPVRPVRIIPVGDDLARRLASVLAAAVAPETRSRSLRWLPRPLATRPRATLAGAIALAAIVVTTVVVIVQRDRGAPRLSGLNENSVGIVDPGNGRLIGQVGVGADPVAAAAGFGSVWTANTDDDSVSRVDTATHQVRTIGVGAAPSAIAVGAGAVWVANSNAGTVTRIDPQSNTPQDPITVGNGPAGVAVGHGSVWVTNSRDATVSRIDPALNREVEVIDVGDTPRGISVGADVWVANSVSNSVSKINGSGRTHVAAASINVGRGPLGIAVVGDTVWVTNALDGNVSRIPTNGTSPVDTVRVGSEPAQLAAVDNHVWIAIQAAKRIAEVGSDTSRVDRVVTLGPVPGGAVAAAGKLWVTTTTDPALHRGGVLRIRGHDVKSIDPTYGASVEQAELLGGSYDGLVGFRHAAGVDGTALVPDLATSLPSPTNRGRTYTFQLRPGIRWSTGRPVTVADVRRGIERAIVWPNSGLAPQIVGGRDCRPQRCDVTGVTVDPATRSVQIDLVQPNENFLNDVAAAVAVPAATPIGEQMSRIVAATGPYQVESYQPQKLVVLTRNRYFREWSVIVQPDGLPDRIEWHVDLSTKPDNALAAVASGSADWTDARFAREPGAVQASFGPRLHVTPSLTMHGLFLNTRIPPFDDVRVRRALAYALDRAAVARSWSTPGVITCQFLPPNYPGYRPYCPYTLNAGDRQTWTSPDVPAAEELVKKVGKRGITVNVYADSDTKAAAFGPVVTALRHLGYQARETVYRKPDYFEHVADTRNSVQAGFFGWVSGGGTAAPYFALWGCDSFTVGDPNNLNPAGFCDPAIDGLRRTAEKVQASSSAAANPLWAKIDRLLVNAAPWIPLVHPKWIDVVSKRVHDYKRNPFIGVLFDQMWVR
ncbi:MAG: extracellular solute-binding protein [Jatrophihabitans sp.]|nr:extracellular solute-binding protein [Jatrophihabitans sp.]